ncbi:immunoglobulin-like domain-containing protein [Eggerthella guodeyinii]|uniref:immunoglobulin-like domain-containing protein n=1 Tax=Eggerthella guodeyinii TaxID=2690837 RepID=UPI001C55027C|nr:immunoglobulin-like domain-containing protein [Eggerthella guodeyinii]
MWKNAKRMSASAVAAILVIMSIPAGGGGAFADSVSSGESVEGGALLEIIDQESPGSVEPEDIVSDASAERVENSGETARITAEEPAVREAGSVEELNSAVDYFKNQQNIVDCTVMLTASIKSNFGGIEGKHVTLRSVEGERFSISSASDIVGDLTVQNVLWGNGSIYANGHTLEFGEEYEGDGADGMTGARIYGGGNGQDVVGGTHLIFRSGMFGRANGGCVYGGGYNADVQGDVLIEVYGDAQMAQRVRGGGVSSSNDKGNVYGNVHILIRQGVDGHVAGINGAGNRSGSAARNAGNVHGDVLIDVMTGSSNGMTGTGEGSVIAENCGNVTGDIAINVGQSGVSEPVVVGGNWSIAGCGEDFGASAHVGGDVRISIADNVIMQSYQGGDLGGDVVGMWNASEIDGTLTIENNGGQLCSIVANDLGLRGTPGQIHNKGQAENGLVIRMTSGDINNYTVPWEHYYNDGVIAVGPLGGLAGNALIEVSGGKVPFIDAGALTDAIAGDLDVQVSKAARIKGIEGSVGGEGLVSGHVSSLLFDGSGASDNPLDVAFLKRFDNVKLVNGASLRLGDNREGDNKVQSAQGLPFRTVYGLAVEGNSRLETVKAQSLVSGNVQLEGMWEQRFVQTADIPNLEIQGSLTVGEAGTLVSLGTTSVKGAVDASGTMALMNPALFQSTFAGDSAEFRLPAVQRTPSDLNYPTGDIALSIKGAATGTASVLTVSSGDWRAAQAPVLGDNYITGWKANGASNEAFVLANDDEATVTAGLYLKRVEDPGVSDGSYYMWQVAKKPSYSVSYEFVSGTKDKELPEAIMDLLPIDSKTYMEGTTVAAIQPDETAIPVADGVWTFKGYDADSKVASGNVHFVGTWEFSAHEYGVTYEFVSGTKDKVLPEEVTNLLPIDAKRYAHGTTVSAIQPGETTVEVTDGVWTFKGYDADSKVASGNVHFVGTWVFNPNASVINHIPAIVASDKVLTVGDTFNPLEGVSATDEEDGDLTDKVEVLSNTVDTSKPGVYEVTYKVTDSKGASSTKTISVTVNPKTEDLNHIPTIAASDKVLTVGDTFNPLEGVSATDEEDGDLTDKVEVLSNTVDTSKPGVYEVTYKVTDSKGASSTKTISVTVNPKTEDLNHIPTIAASDKVLTVGDIFNPLEGVSATDEEDGDLTDKVEVLSNTVDTSKPGVYEVTYKVTDSKGASSTKTISVTVNPKTEDLNHIPTIAASDKVLTVGDIFNPLEGVSATDEEDGDLTDKVEVLSNTVDTSKPGVYEVTYKVTDSKGASSTKTISVTVNPKTEDLNHIPTIAASDRVLTVGDTFNPLEGVSATDEEDGDLTDKVEVLSNTVDTSKPGVYEVTYKVTDSKGASSTKTISVTVNPKTEDLNHIPTIAASDKVLTVGDIFNPLEGVSATDEEDGDLTDKVEVLSNTVDTSKPGVYEVTYKVTDSKGASSTKTISVTVNPKTEDLNHIPTIAASDKVLTVGDIFNPLEGVSATDEEDGDLTDKVEVLSNTVDTSKPGVYEVTYKVTDSKGASSTKTISVTVNPKTEDLNHIPTIAASDKVLTVGDIFNPLEGVSATDEEDGDLTDKVEVLSNTVDTSKPGVYEVTYKVTDSKGASSTKTISVTVNPKTEDLNHIPTIAASDKVLTVGDTFNPLEGVSATDEEDGDLTDKVEVLSNTVDTSKPGVYEVTYKVTDSKGASSTKTISVTVNPKTEDLNHIPTIAASDKVLTVGDIFNPLEGVSATDEEDGDLTDKVEVLSNTVDTSKPGVYEVTYKVTDSKGASSVKTIKVTVEARVQELPDNSSNSSSAGSQTPGDKLIKTGDTWVLGAGILSVTAALAGVGVLVAWRRMKNKSGYIK